MVRDNDRPRFVAIIESNPASDDRTRQIVSILSGEKDGLVTLEACDDGSSHAHD